MPSLEYEYDIKALKYLGTYYLASNFIQIYAFFHCLMAFLFLFMPNSFILGCGAASFLLDVYVNNLLQKHNFDPEAVVEKRRKELEEDKYDDEDFS